MLPSPRQSVRDCRGWILFFKNSHFGPIFGPDQPIAGHKMVLDIHITQGHNPPGVQQQLLWVEEDEFLRLLRFPQEPNNREGQTLSIPNVYLWNHVFWQVTVAFRGKTICLCPGKPGPCWNQCWESWHPWTPVLWLLWGVHGQVWERPPDGLNPIPVLLTVPHTAPQPSPGSSVPSCSPSLPSSPPEGGRTHRQFRCRGRDLSPPQAPLTASAPPFTISCRASPSAATALARAGRHVPPSSPSPGTPSGLQERRTFPWEGDPLIPPHHSVALLAAASTARPAQCRHLPHPPPWKDAVETCFVPGKTVGCTLDPVLLPVMATGSLSPGSPMGTMALGLRAAPGAPASQETHLVFFQGTVGIPDLCRAAFAAIPRPHRVAQLPGWGIWGSSLNFWGFRGRRNIPRARSHYWRGAALAEQVRNLWD